MSDKMILDYYRYFYSQDDIALEPGYSAGVCSADQSGGYEDLAHDHLESTYDTSPIWDKSEIDAVRPLKSGVPFYARAIAGYEECGGNRFIWCHWK